MAGAREKQGVPDSDGSLAAGRRQTLRQRLALALLAVPALVVLGAVGYMVIEGWSFSDALFMAVTTITTVGYGEVRPLTERGRAFTIVLLLVGLAALWYGLSVLVSVVVEGELAIRLGVRRMERHLQGIHGHHIIAGFGRVGRQTAHALRQLGHQVVVVDKEPDAMAAATAAGFPAVAGNATEDATLVRAGIERAAGLVAALGSDADNVFVTLSARALHPALPIVARANDAGAVPKLTRAGATQVVSPYAMAGRQMARLALRPGTVDFIENLFAGGAGSLVVEDIRVDAESLLAGLQIQHVREQAPYVVILAVLRDGQTIAPPPPDLVLASGDEIAAMGSEADLKELEERSQARP
jgi:voltage-gated potassium channel